MSDDPREAFGPAAAAGRIEQAGKAVAVSRRWHVGSMIALGCVSLGYLALLGSLTAKGSGPNMLLAVIPIVTVYLLLGVRRRHPPTSGRQLQAVESRWGNIYMLTLLPAGIIAVTVPHPVPAAFAGIIPAIPCFVGAWRAVGL